jgi:glycosyltransferase involved in cell wall biosynthesis
MKVLHVIPSISERSGGPGQAIIPMCKALAEAGVEVLLATTDEGVSSSEFRVSSLEPAVEVHSSRTVRCIFKDVPTIMFPVQLGTSFKYSRPFAQWLETHVADYDVVHIHAVFNHSSIAAARACRQKRVPYVLRPLGTLGPWSMNQKSWRKRVFWHGGVKALLSSAAAVHYTAKAEQIATEQSLRLNHGVVVPLGVDAHEGGPVSRKVLARKLPALGDHSYVLVLSRLLPTKGLDVLLEAFLSLINDKGFAEWRLVFAGDGDPEYVSKLKQKIDAAGAGAQVLFSGWVDGEEKQAVVSNASLLALPSYHENFGLCVMEAMAVGVPVLISPEVSLAAEVEAVKAGWVAAIKKEAIEAALELALRSTEERRRRGLAARALSEGFTWPVVATNLKDLYSSIVKQPV